MDEIASDSGQEDRPTFNVGCISCSAVSIRGRGCAARPAVSYRDRDERSRAECETTSKPKIEVSKGTSRRESGYSPEAMMSKRSRPIRHPPIDLRDRSRTLSRMALVSSWSRTKTFILLVDRCSPPLSHFLVVVPIPCVLLQLATGGVIFPAQRRAYGSEREPWSALGCSHAWVTALPKGDPLTAVQLSPCTKGYWDNGRGVLIFNYQESSPCYFWKTSEEVYSCAFATREQRPLHREVIYITKCDISSTSS